MVMNNSGVEGLKRELEDSHRKTQAKENELTQAREHTKVLETEIQVKEKAAHTKQTEILTMENEIKLKKQEIVTLLREVENKKQQLKATEAPRKRMETEIIELKRHEDQEHLQLTRLTREEEDARRKEGKK